MTSKVVRIIARGIRNLLANFDVSVTFRSRHLSDAPAPPDIATLTFYLAGDGGHSDTGLHPSSAGPFKIGVRPRHCNVGRGSTAYLKVGYKLQ